MPFTVASATPPLPATKDTIPEAVQHVEMLLNAGVPQVCVTLDGYEGGSPDGPVLTFTGGKNIEFFNSLGKFTLPPGATSLTVLLWVNLPPVGPVAPVGPILHIQCQPAVDWVRGLRLWSQGAGIFSLEMWGENGNQTSPGAMVQPDPEGWFPVVVSYNYAIDAYEAYAVNNWANAPTAAFLGGQGGLQMGTPSKISFGLTDSANGLVADWKVRVAQVAVWNRAIEVTEMMGLLNAGDLGADIEFDAAHADVAQLVWPSFHGDIDATLTSPVLLVDDAPGF